jgi:hypothetical protein
MTVRELRQGRGAGPISLGEYHSWIAATNAEAAIQQAASKAKP